MFYDVPIKWCDGTQTKGRGMGNNAGWICQCDKVMLGTYRFPTPDCPDCKRRFHVIRGKNPQYVAYVEEVVMTTS